jgi:hypothetical protein
MMPDKSESHVEKTTSKKPIRTLEDAAKTDDKKFEERFHLFMSELSDACEKHNVKAAVAIVADPEISDGLITFMAGEDIHVAEMLASLLRPLKAKILNRLEA